MLFVVPWPLCQDLRKEGKEAPLLCLLQVQGSVGDYTIDKSPAEFLLVTKIRGHGNSSHLKLRVLFYFEESNPG